MLPYLLSLFLFAPVSVLGLALEKTCSTSTYRSTVHDTSTILSVESYLSIYDCPSTEVDSQPPAITITQNGSTTVPTSTVLGINPTGTLIRIPDSSTSTASDDFALTPVPALEPDSNDLNTPETSSSPKPPVETGAPETSDSDVDMDSESADSSVSSIAAGPTSSPGPPASSNDPDTDSDTSTNLEPPTESGASSASEPQDSIDPEDSSETSSSNAPRPPINPESSPGSDPTADTGSDSDSDSTTTSLGASTINPSDTPSKSIDGGSPESTSGSTHDLTDGSTNTVAQPEATPGQSETGSGSGSESTSVSQDEQPIPTSGALGLYLVDKAYSLMSVAISISLSSLLTVG